MKKQDKKIKVASFFSGCGGGDLGLTGGFNFLGENYPVNGFEIVWANDIEPFAVESYKKNISNHIIKEDIRSVASESIPDHDLLIGGFPCQSFSIVGKRGGLEDPRGTLYLEMIRVVRDKMPAVIIVENVKGLVNIKNGDIFKKILQDFKECGYKISYKVVNASLYGVPQKRERVIIVGVRNDIGKQFIFPSEPHKIIPLTKVLEKNVDQKYFFSKRAVEGLKNANKAFNKGRAQDISKPCNTISTHLAKVSLNGTDPVLFLDNRYRRLTPLEAARVQSFGDDFEFVGSDAKQYVQIGNAIPPVLMWHIAHAVHDQIFNSKPIHKKEKEQNNVSHKKEKYLNKIKSVPVFV